MNAVVNIAKDSTLRSRDDFKPETVVKMQPSVAWRRYDEHQPAMRRLSWKWPLTGAENKRMRWTRQQQSKVFSKAMTCRSREEAAVLNVSILWWAGVGHSHEKQHWGSFRGVSPCLEFLDVKYRLEKRGSNAPKRAQKSVGLQYHKIASFDQSYEVQAIHHGHARVLTSRNHRRARVPE